VNIVKDDNIRNNNIAVKNEVILDEQKGELKFRVEV